MFFLSLLSLDYNIACSEDSLRVIFGQNCLFFQKSDENAYFLRSKHIKACKLEYVKGWRTWLNSERSLQKLNSRENKRKIASLK